MNVGNRSGVGLQIPLFSVLTLTDAGLLVEVVACWTLTLETAKGVYTVSTLAETWQLLALINI